MKVSRLKKILEELPDDCNLFLFEGEEKKELSNYMVLDNDDDYVTDAALISKDVALKNV